jgi:hypothetical protein
MKTSFFAKLAPFFSLAILGCATNGVADYRSLGISADFTEPRAGNSYKGVLVETQSGSGNELARRATEICNRFGGLRNPPTLHSRNHIGWTMYSYQCNGPSASPVRQELNSAPLQQELERVRAESEAAKKRQQELEEQLKQSREQPVIPVQAVASPTTDRLSLDASKTKCAELGFKPATEGFGKCVLQLSK